jgi:hypothetical protein
VEEMSEKDEQNELSTEERIKNLEEKAGKVEILLTMNFCISFIGVFIFLGLGGIFGFFIIIFIVFLGIYGILNLLILNTKNKKSPK